MADINPTATLLGLPVEIRLQIFSWLYQGQRFHYLEPSCKACTKQGKEICSFRYCRWSDKGRLSSMFSLFTVNKTIGKESMEAFLQHASFRFPLTSGCRTRPQQPEEALISDRRLLQTRNYHCDGSDTYDLVSAKERLGCFRIGRIDIPGFKLSTIGEILQKMLKYEKVNPCRERVLVLESTVVLHRVEQPSMPCSDCFASRPGTIVEMTIRIDRRELMVFECAPFSHFDHKFPFEKFQLYLRKELELDKSWSITFYPSVESVVRDDRRHLLCEVCSNVLQRHGVH